MTPALKRQRRPISNESKATAVYRVSSRPVRALWRPCLTNKNKTEGRVWEEREGILHRKPSFTVRNRKGISLWLPGREGLGS